MYKRTSRVKECTQHYIREDALKQLVLKQLKQEIEALTAEVSEAGTEMANATKLIAVTKKYTCIDELTPEVINAFVYKIIVHEREKKTGNGHRKPASTIPMLGLWTSPRTRKCGQWNRNICSGLQLHVKPPKYRRGRRKSMLLLVHIYFYPYLV